jgi:cytochrome c oxidase accessory protein FixG
MCPYARFQGVMMDPDTVTVTYDAVRGEPRGARHKNASLENLGDCVDCKYCVQVCPTGIDIRDGAQIECINCGLCVDACDHMMDKMNYPRGLISYTSVKQLELKHGNAAVIPHPLLRKRVFIYGGLILLILFALVYRIATRAPVRLDVMRDRAVMSRETPTGDLENIYRLQVLNMSEVPRHFEVTVSGIPGAFLHSDQTHLDVAPLENRWMAIDIDVPEAQVHEGTTPVTVTVTASDDPSIVASSPTLFYKPH